MLLYLVKIIIIYIIFIDCNNINIRYYYILLDYILYVYITLLYIYNILKYAFAY